MKGLIEHTFDILKSWMRCLTKEVERGKVCKIVVACCIVNNIAIRHGMPLEVQEDMELPEDVALPPQQYDMAEGRRLQQ